jgi:hypothetical protein
MFYALSSALSQAYTTGAGHTISIPIFTDVEQLAPRAIIEPFIFFAGRDLTPQVQAYLEIRAQDNLLFTG